MPSVNDSRVVMFWVEVAICAKRRKPIDSASIQEVTQEK